MKNRTTMLVALVLAGCVGDIGDRGSDEPSGGGITGTDPGDPRLEARVWRLTPAQYNGEVQRFFPGAPEVILPPGSSEFGITNISATARIDLGNASQFNDAAKSVGTWAASQGASAARCTTFGTKECVDTFLGWFPEAAYRRPLTAEEKTELQGVYDDVEPTYGPEWGFSALVRTVLLSPQFLYRYEVGPAGKGVVEIDSNEIASLIAFSLTDAAPDDQLLADAKAGKLHDPAVREKHARRLMAESGPLWQRFFWEWLKMSTLYTQGNETGLDPALVTQLEDEYRAFVSHIVVDDRGSLKDLLTTSHTWGPPEIADYYGAPPGGADGEIALDPEQRGGLLTLGAWLVSHGKKGRDNVVRRGMAIYRDAMCNDIAPLNIDLQAALKDLVGADATIKEIVEARGKDPVCGTCHHLADPVGLAFETYAGDGTWQTTYPDGKPVEATTTLEGVGTFDNAPALSGALADDVSFQQCLVRRFGHFVMGAEFGAPSEVRAAKVAYDAFHQTGSFEELLVAIVRDRSFIERRK